MKPKARNERGTLLVEWSLTLVVRVLLSLFLVDIGIYYIKSLIVSNATSTAADYLRLSAPNRAGNPDDRLKLEEGLKASIVQAAGGIVKNEDVCASRGSSSPPSDCLESQGSMGVVNAARPTPSAQNSQPYWVNIGVGAPIKTMSGALSTKSGTPLPIRNSIGVRVSEEPPLLDIEKCQNGQQLVYDESSHTMSCRDTFGGFFTRWVCRADAKFGDLDTGYDCREGNPRLGTDGKNCSCPTNFSPVAIARFSNYTEGATECFDKYYENRGAILFLCVIGKGT